MLGRGVDVCGYFGSRGRGVDPRKFFGAKIAIFECFSDIVSLNDHKNFGGRYAHLKGQYPRNFFLNFSSISGMFCGMIVWRDDGQIVFTYFFKCEILICSYFYTEM